MIPPKPSSRPRRVSLWKYMRLFRKDILSAQPAHLYRAWMAHFRTPFFQSFLLNQPDLINTVLKERPDDFPKSDRVGEGLRPILGNSVFLTNGDLWKRQRRIINPAFEGGRLRETFGAMWQAAEAAAQRLSQHAGQIVEIESQTSHAAADVIFRTLFSIPIEHHLAEQVFEEFRAYQRSQPILNLAAFVPLPRWMPRLRRRATRLSAARIRTLIRTLVIERQARIDAGNAPDDLATKIMTTRDPQTGDIFNLDEMIDQVAIFFLAGHETSASALAWTLYLLALYPEWQDQVVAEAQSLSPGDQGCDFAVMAKLPRTRDVFREALRLYPPVPMMVREASQPELFRGRDVPENAQLVISPWHLHRHERIWKDPDMFDPARWQNEETRRCARSAYIPFSAGSRVCPGAGFAMIEGPLILAHILRDLRVALPEGAPPVPVAHLTVRAQNGIALRIIKPD